MATGEEQKELPRLRLLLLQRARRRAPRSRPFLVEKIVQRVGRVVLEVAKRHVRGRFVVQLLLRKLLLEPPRLLHFALLLEGGDTDHRCPETVGSTVDAAEEETRRRRGGDEEETRRGKDALYVSILQYMVDACATTHAKAHHCGGTTRYNTRYTTSTTE